MKNCRIPLDLSLCVSTGSSGIFKACGIGLAFYCAFLVPTILPMYPDAIIRVQPECATTTEGVTRISLTSDAPVFYGYAKCHKGHSFNFTEVDMANHQLFVHYSGKESQHCVFDKKQLSRTYTLQVFVVVGTDNGVLMDEQFYLITCTYDAHASEVSGVKDFGRGLKPAQEITVNKGNKAQSKIALAAVDILGTPIPGSLTLGTKIKLRATMTESAPGEVSFHPLTCKASSPGVEYPILVAGCGDGRVFPPNSGFTTIGTVAYGPIFKTFRLKGARSLTFTCTYYICSEPCDGNSCITKQKDKEKMKERPRRELREEDLTTDTISSSTLPEERSNVIPASGSVIKGVYSSTVQYYIHDHDIGPVVFAEDEDDDQISGSLPNTVDMGPPVHLANIGEFLGSGSEDGKSKALLLAVCITSTVAITSICAVVYLLYKTKTIIDQDGSVAGSGISVRSYSTTSVLNEHFMPSSSESLHAQRT